MKFNWKKPLIMGILLAGGIVSGLNDLYGQENKREKKEQIEKKKDKEEVFNFLEKIYIKTKNPMWEERSDFSKLEDLAKIYDEKGKRAYKLKEILKLDYWELEKDELNLINEKNKNGKRMFDLNDLFEIWRFNGEWVSGKFIKQSTQDIIKILKYKDKNGEPIFSKNDLTTYLNYKINLKNLIEEIDASKNEKPKEIAKKIYREKIKNDLNSLLDFKDTKKPNVLIIWPYSDWNGSFRGLWAGNWLKEDNFTLKNLKEYYDLKLSFAETEKEVYSAIREISKIEFLVICGHGERKSLSLKEVDSRIFNSRKNEEYSIDISDKEFKNYLDMLNDSAVIFLHSCSNAKESFLNEKNLARFISKIAENKKIVAWKKSFSSSDIFVKKYYPFELKKDPKKTEWVYYLNGKNENNK